MSQIVFNLAAKCDKAGRSQNQDNYWACPDLSKINESFDNIIGKDKDVVLSEKGALFVVADGMGGMNAGEKASELVINGIKQGFSKIPEEILGNDEHMLSFIRNTIIESDKTVKNYAQTHREAKGLGSTIVLVWLYGDKAYCGWCGDSRIYRYNPNNELVRLSHDHSYVQELVDDRKIEPDEAFDHPDSNIIMRSLGDNGEPANPETRIYEICERDMFLLCSDGLCGLLQDKQIEDIIALNCSSTKDALAALWQKGDAAGWSDNATIELLFIIEGGKRPKGVGIGYPDVRKPVETNKNSTKDKNQQTSKSLSFKKLYIYLITVVALVLLGFAIFGGNHSQEESTSTENSGQNNVYDVTPLEPDNNKNTIEEVVETDQESFHTIPPNSEPTTSESTLNNDDKKQSDEKKKDPQPQTVSDEYQKLFESAQKDYLSIYSLWEQILKQNYMLEADSAQLTNYVKNVTSLKNQPDYRIIDKETKNFIDNYLVPLSNTISKNKDSIDVRTNKQENNMPQLDNEMFHLNFSPNKKPNYHPSRTR